MYKGQLDNQIGYKNIAACRKITVNLTFMTTGFSKLQTEWAFL